MGSVRRRRVGAEDEIRDFRLKRDILSVWNILIGHSRMVKNDSRMNRNQILKWETFYFKTTNYTSTDQNQTSHTFYADTLQLGYSLSFIL